MNLAITNKKYLIGIILISLLSTNLITYYFANKKNSPIAENNSDQTTQASFSNNGSSCEYKVKRLGGYDYIKPILFVDNQCESDNLSSLKQNITSLINNYKNTGELNSASVYLKEYSTNGWMGINTEEKFLPGSLMKVPVLIAFLKMEEANPGVLNKTYLYNKNYIADKHPKYVSKSIQLGHSYSVRELLNYMIEDSDNNATSLLFENMNVTIFKKVFTDFGLVSPDVTSQNYPITAKEYTYFMRALYNASYLNNKNSEYATELLSKCNFKDGMVSAIPKGTKIAHKFGESGDPLEKELNESAIIYLNNNPYTITIMTKGKDVTKLPAVIRQISSMVYQDMVNTAHPSST